MSNQYQYIPCKTESKIPACKWSKFQREAGSEIIPVAISCEQNRAIVPDPSFFVLDIDTKHGDGVAEIESVANATIAELAQTTRVVRTPSGGYHLYYQCPPDEPVGNTASTVFTYSDTRGHNGYVLAPESFICDPDNDCVGSYELVGLDLGPQELPACPLWLANALTIAQKELPPSPPKPIQMPDDPQKRLDPYVSTILSELQSTHTHRNNTLFVKAMKIKELCNGYGLAKEHYDAQIFTAAVNTGLGESECRKTLESANRKAVSDRFLKDREPEQVQTSTSTPQASSQGILEGSEGKPRGLTNLNSFGDGYDLLDPDADLSVHPPEIGTMDDCEMGLFYKGEINGLFAHGGLGKSTCIINAVLKHLDDYRVFYLDWENSERKHQTTLATLQMSREVHGESLRNYKPINMAGENLDDTMIQNTIENEGHDMSDCIFVVDSVDSAMSSLGMNFNENPPVIEFYNKILRKLTAVGATVILVDHQAKSSEGLVSPRGGSAKVDQITGIIYEFKQTSICTRDLIIRKDRMGGTGPIGMAWAAVEMLDDGTLEVMSNSERPGKDRKPVRPMFVYRTLHEILVNNGGQISSVTELARLYAEQSKYERSDTQIRKDVKHLILNGQFEEIDGTGRSKSLRVTNILLDEDAVS